MRQLVAVGMRLHTRLERSRFGGDLLAALAGFGFFSFSVGFEKLNPRNVAWLTFGDQQQHLLGWWFYSSDQWRWPLGANPRWGWEGTNSVVYTDSWPGMALIFKALNIDAVNHGQYFGLGFLFGAIALFVGDRGCSALSGVQFYRHWSQVDCWERRRCSGGCNAGTQRSPLGCRFSSGPCISMLPTENSERRCGVAGHCC